MVKTIVLGFAVLALSFFVGTSYVHAQEATETPTPTVTDTPTDDEETDTPTAAPQTGFGY